MVAEAAVQVRHRMVDHTSTVVLALLASSTLLGLLDMLFVLAQNRRAPRVPRRRCNPQERR